MDQNMDIETLARQLTGDLLKIEKASQATGMFGSLTLIRTGVERDTWISAIDLLPWEKQGTTVIIRAGLTVKLSLD